MRCYDESRPRNKAAAGSMSGASAAASCDDTCGLSHIRIEAPMEPEKETGGGGRLAADDARASAVGP